ncbi:MULTISPECIES: DsbA family oxidoreductase [unclassified Pseudoxanthomonas]|uniref:DsbA family oxidoreductase n=1 Tax=unclassified Pseudoxanthomonas TaxID=2645906 RepID=UPI00161ADED4|nr:MULTISPECIES: DsbA family oxidoreductase [unclassified Pseudoxanthomonas]MBB3276629.1 putative DsbA family dithiol-disulfide isomerase [Pseudoxanthomonas sp. OG2]MBV7472295.1 DsbA family oxidoreductase [Pseudoxanthomonas sp. PXM05]
MSQPVKIDFVSDVVCPWCAIGLQSLEQAIARVGGDLQVELHFQPFELNPQMQAGGEDVVEHLTRKYGMSAEQARSNSEAIRQRGASLGFTFDMDRRRRIVNTFDAHRLLHWAEQEHPDMQRALKHALLRAYFSEGQDVSSPDVLAQLAESVGLDGARARAILASDEYAEAVRARERLYQEHGINAVPSVVFNDRHLIQGGQPVEVFEQALRQLSGIAG